MTTQLAAPISSRKFANSCRLPCPFHKARHFQIVWSIGNSCAQTSHWLLEIDQGLIPAGAQHLFLKWDCRGDDSEHGLDQWYRLDRKPDRARKLLVPLDGRDCQYADLNFGLSLVTRCRFYFKAREKGGSFGEWICGMSDVYLVAVSGAQVRWACPYKHCALLINKAFGILQCCDTVNASSGTSFLISG